MDTMTLSFPRSSLTSSTTPMKWRNGPSLMRTFSSLLNVTAGRGRACGAAHAGFEGPDPRLLEQRLAIIDIGLRIAPR